MLFLCSCLFACVNKADSENVLRHAYQIVDNYPDSVLKILSDTHISVLNGKQWADYILLEVMAKDKANLDISGDTTVFELGSSRYFKNDIQKKALAYFYSGRVRQSSGDVTEAMHYYLAAAENAQDNNLKGLIHFWMGYLHYFDFSLEKALNEFEKSLIFFKKAANTKNEINTLCFMANCYLLNEEPENTFTTYQQALELAEMKQDTAALYNIYQNIGVLYHEIDSLDESIRYLLKARNIAPDNEKARININIAETFFNKNQPDSAHHYAGHALSVENTGNEKIINMYSFLSKIEAIRNNHEKALEYHHIYVNKLDSVWNQISEKKTMEIQEKYNYTSLENEKNKLLIHRLILFLVISVLLVVCVFTFLMVYKAKADNKNLQLQLQNDIYAVKRLADDNRLQVLFHFKELSLLNELLDDDKEYKTKELKKRLKAIISNINWETVYPLINEIHNGFIDELKIMLLNNGMLDEKEFQICSLAYAGFDNREIGIVLNMKQGTVQVKKSHIRRKIGIDYRQNFKSFFDNKYNL